MWKLRTGGSGTLMIRETRHVCQRTFAAPAGAVIEAAIISVYS